MSPFLRYRLRDGLRPYVVVVICSLFHVYLFQSTADGCKRGGLFLEATSLVIIRVFGALYPYGGFFQGVVFVFVTTVISEPWWKINP